MNKINLHSTPQNLPIPKDDGACDHLTGKEIPDISLITLNGEYLKIKRKESFRLVFYCYPMTGRPEKPLPKNWNNIPGARGCTPENSSFRDHYEELIKLNALPIGITTQRIEDIKEMTKRLNIKYDILSDCNLKFTESLKLPTFSIDNNIYIKRLTMIVLNCNIVKVFYPIFPPEKHIIEVLNWLEHHPEITDFSTEVLPRFMGRIAMMLPGVRPNMSLASLPTAWT